jgi:lipoic acid synthetase
MQYHSKFPAWIKRPVPVETTVVTRGILDRLGLHTVCSSAKCPNQGECYSKKKATFLLLGDVCTRRCRFCGVKQGIPQAVDATEAERIVQAIQHLELVHVVITSVTRDDLADGGARHFKAVIEQIKKVLPQVTVEVLVPDFQGRFEATCLVAEALPDIFNHNIETVKRLFPAIRPEGNYDRSLNLLKRVKQNFEGMLVKSGLMVGLGEDQNEVEQTMVDLAENGCDIVTIGQYLQPSQACVTVKRFVSPEEFGIYKRMGNALGISHVFAGPFVRSSYMAEEVFSNVRSVLL